MSQRRISTVSAMNVLGGTTPGKSLEEKKAMIVKSKIAQRLKTIVHETKPPPPSKGSTKKGSSSSSGGDGNDDDDDDINTMIEDLTTEYRRLKKQLSSLVKSLKQYSETTMKMNAARDQAVKDIAQIAANSPLGVDVGLKLDAKATKSLDAICNDPTMNSGTLSSKKDVLDIAEEWEIRNPDSSSSLRIVQRLASVQAVVDSRDYQLNVVDYAEEWYIVVKDQVDSEIARVKKLGMNRRHYEQKVSSIQKQVESITSKGKQPKTELTDKLDRNKIKCDEAIQSHKWESNRLYVLLDTVVNDGWQELHRLCINYMKWESDRIAGENDTYRPLGRIMNSIDDIYDQRDNYTSTQLHAAKNPNKKKEKRKNQNSRSSKKKKIPPPPAKKTNKMRKEEDNDVVTEDQFEVVLDTEEEGITVEEELDAPPSSTEFSLDDEDSVDDISPSDEEDYIPDDDSDHQRGNKKSGTRAVDP